MTPYEAALDTYRLLHEEHRTALTEYNAGRITRSEYRAARDRSETAAREMLRLRDETNAPQLSLSLDTAGPERAA